MDHDIMDLLARKTITANLSELQHAINFVSSFASHAIKDVWKVELAVEEAIVNIVEHGYKHNAGSIDIVCKTTPTSLIVCLQDTSWPFNPTTYQSTSCDAFSIRGRGIVLMRAVTDELEYTHDGKTNTLTLKKQR